jgi:hypothetical protein
MKTTRDKIMGGAAIAAIFVVMVAAYNIFDSSPVMDYGAAEKSYFRPDVAAPGEQVQICFDDASWMRLCPSKLKVWFFDNNGKRLDFDDAFTVHTILLPAKVGKLPPKCRAWMIPTGLPEGHIVQEGIVTSECPPLGSWWVIRKDFPRLRLTVRKQ